MPPAAVPPLVLIVDDEVDLLRFLRETLGTFSVCALDTSPSSEYAFELALEKPYNLSLILSSGHGEAPRARELLHESGVNGLLAKPFSIARLLAQVELCPPGSTRPLAP